MRSVSCFLGTFCVFCFNIITASSQPLGEQTGAILLRLRDPKEFSELERAQNGIAAGATSSEMYRSLADALSHGYGMGPGEQFLALPQLHGSVVSKASVADPAETPPDQEAYLKLEIPKGVDIERVLSMLNADPRIVYAEPEYMRRPVRIPNDPLFSDQYAHNIAIAPPAWDVQLGSDVKIAIVDTGVDYTHPDLAPNMLPGYDFMNGDDDPMDEDYHGTHCAGIAAARGDNGVGVAGVAWNAKIIPVRVLSSYGGTDATVSAGIRYAAEKGASVISLSLGGPGFSQTMLDAVRYANSLNAVVVAAAGNDGDSKMMYPAGYEEVIAVAASDSLDAKAAFSSFGSWVDITAPGVMIMSTLPKGEYGYLSGTSMATPYVAGALALLRAHRPELTVEGVTASLGASADDISSQNPGMLGNLGAGRVNVSRLLSTTVRNFVRITRMELEESSGNRDGMIQPGETYLLRLRVKNAANDLQNVRATVSSGNALVTVSDPVSDFGNLLTGMASGNEGDLVSFTISSNAPFGASLGELKVVITAGAEVILESSLSLRVGLPQVTGFPVMLGDLEVGAITVDDLQGDGTPEIIFGGSGQQVWVLKNNGQAVAGWPKALPIPSKSSQGVNGIAVGNLVGDATKEIVVASEPYYINEKYPVFAFGAAGGLLPGWPKNLSPGIPDPSRGIAIEYGASIPSLVDLDSDGLYEVLFGECPGSLFITAPSKVYVVDGQGRDVAGLPFSSDTPLRKGSLSLSTDIDGDGTPEFAFTGQGGDVLLYRRNGNFLSSTKIGSLYGNPYGLASVDLYGDSRRRITSLGEVGPSLIGPAGRQERGFPSTNGLPSNSSGVGASWKPSGAFSGPIWGDFDGDGYFEAIFGANAIIGGQSRLLVHSLDAFGFAKRGFPITFGTRADLKMAGQILVHDLDGDGYADFLVPFTSGIEAISSQGKRLPQWSFDYPTGCVSTSYSTPAIEDLNGDGAMDLIFACKKDKAGMLSAITLPGSRAGTARIWPMFQHDPQRSGAIPGSGLIPPTPTPSPTPTFTNTPIPTATRTPVPTRTPSISPTRTPSVSPTRTPAVAPTQTAQPMPTVGTAGEPPVTNNPVKSARWLSSKVSKTKTGKYAIKVTVAVEGASETVLKAQTEWLVGKRVVTRTFLLRKTNHSKLRVGEVSYSGAVTIAKTKGMSARINVMVPGILASSRRVRL